MARNSSHTVTSNSLRGPIDGSDVPLKIKRVDDIVRVFNQFSIALLSFFESVLRALERAPTIELA